MPIFKLTWVAFGKEYKKFFDSKEELIVNYEFTVLNAFNGSKAFVDDECILNHKIHGWEDCDEEKRIRLEWKNCDRLKEYYSKKKTDNFKL